MHGIAENETRAPSGKRRVLDDDKAEAVMPVGVAIIFEDDDDDDE